MIALDHLVATQEKHRIELKTMSDPMHRYVLRILDKQVNETSGPSLPRFLALQKWHVRYTLTIMKLLTRMVT